MRERGYTLVALVVALVVINIAVGAAVHLWSDIGQREKEHELIFRGLQYAEAIRVFQQRFGRQPTSLEELYEVKPRCLRQLWTDPLSETGEGEPIMARRGAGRAVVQSVRDRSIFSSPRFALSAPRLTSRRVMSLPAPRRVCAETGLYFPR